MATQMLGKAHVLTQATLTTWKPTWKQNLSANAVSQAMILQLIKEEGDAGTIDHDSLPWSLSVSVVIQTKD